VANSIQVTLGGSLELVLRPPRPEPQSVITAQFGAFVVKAKGDSMAYTLPVDMLIRARVDYVDNAGNPATVDGDVTWETSATDLVTLTVDPGDSQICTISAGTRLGTAQVSATVDADLGDGVRELVTLLDVAIVAGEAMAGVISPVGEPEPVGEHVEPRK
jgi:hypothetical protein